MFTTSHTPIRVCEREYGMMMDRILPYHPSKFTLKTLLLQKLLASISLAFVVVFKSNERKKGVWRFVVLFSITAGVLLLGFVPAWNARHCTFYATLKKWALEHRLKEWNNPALFFNFHSERLKVGDRSLRQDHWPGADCAVVCLLQLLLVFSNKKKT